MRTGESLNRNADERPVSENEGPEGWCRATLRELASRIQYGYTASASHDSNGPRFLRITDIQNGKVNWESVPTCEIAPNDLEKFALRPGDIVFARTGATTGKSFLIGSCPANSVFASYLIRLQPAGGMNSAYLSLFFQTPEYWQFISENVAGNAQPNCNASKLAGLMVPLPPVAEQKRIVERVEQPLALTRAARQRLTCVLAILKHFRQAVLAAGCSGRLTADWRDHQTGLQSGPDLLSEINRLRSRQPTRTRKLASNGESECTDLDLPDCPDGWVWTTIKQVAEVQGGIQKQPKRAPKKNSYPYLRVANVLRDRLDLSEIHRMELFDGELETYRLQRGDLLIIEGNGSLNEIGRSAIWTGEIENCVHQNHIIRVRACLCSPQYLNIYWNSPFGRSNVSQAAVTTSGLYSLSTAKIANLPVTIPSLAEQHEIVRRVEALLKLTDVIEGVVGTVAGRAERLSQAILAKAFRGELVPTEAELARSEGRAYESASDLLARIQSERPGLIDRAGARRKSGKRQRLTAPPSKT